MIANFAVTYRCNGRCRTCNIWKMERPEQGEMSTRDVQRLFEDNRGFLGDVRSIQLTGGEPFIREDLLELVSTIHNNLPGCTFWIPTNGMTPETVENTAEMLEVLEGRSLGVSVSIDGLEETHDGIRGVEGSFRKAVKILEGLSSLRDQHRNLALSVGMTITKENHREMPGVAHIAKHHGADFTFRPVNRSEIYYRNTAGAPNPAFIAEEILPSIQEFGRDLIRARGLRASIPRLRYMQGALDYIRDPGRRSLPCSAATDSFFLDPYGNVYPCIFLDMPLGNALEKPLHEIWGSREATVARRIIGGGGCPNCWVECETFRDIHRDVKGLLSTALRALLSPPTAGIR
jgi:MoaA/NifB/PqqE/SkfB family radical SAM enzyme